METYSFGGLTKLGFYTHNLIERTLLDRATLAIDNRNKEFKKLLSRYGTCYQIETVTDVFKYVAWLDKPLAEILDELSIPREKNTTTFTEFHGPLEYNPFAPVVRRVVPGLLKPPKGFAQLDEKEKHLKALSSLMELQVQPMFQHVVNLPIMGRIDVSQFERDENV